MCSDRRNAGYTLIEVLVAFMILALALTVLLRIFSSGLRNVSVSSDYAKAVLIAESRLASAAIEGGMSPGESRGSVGGGFQWTQRVTNYVAFPDDPASAPDLPAYYITVTVEWRHAGGTRSIDLSTVRLLRTGGLGS